MFIPSISARVIITPAQSDISEQEYSRAGNDVLVGEYTIKTSLSLDETPNYTSVGFTFTPEIVKDCNAVIAETKKNLPALRKYSFYVTRIDFGVIDENGKFVGIYYVNMRSHVIGITNSSIQAQFPTSLLNKQKVVLA